MCFLCLQTVMKKKHKVQYIIKASVFDMSIQQMADIVVWFHDQILTHVSFAIALLKFSIMLGTWMDIMVTGFLVTG